MRLPRTFYLRPTLVVARDLPGRYLFRKLGRTLFAGRIVEVEAYLGEHDPASHAYRGRTPRNDVMFRAGGHLYVYFTYGMHFCCNIVTEGEGKGRAILIRAVEPFFGIERMRELRSPGSGHRPTDAELCNGPGKLCQAFSIARSENGTDLCGDTIWIARKRGAQPPEHVARSARIGISSAKENLWRFFLRNSSYVSRR